MAVVDTSNEFSGGVENAVENFSGTGFSNPLDVTKSSTQPSSSLPDKTNDFPQISNKRTSCKKKVGFVEEDTVQYVPCARDMDKDQRREVWWEMNELSQIKQDACIFGAALRHGRRGIYHPCLKNIPEVQQFMSRHHESVLHERPPTGERQTWLCMLGRSSRGLEQFSTPNMLKERRHVIRDIVREQNQQQQREPTTSTATRPENMSNFSQIWVMRAKERARRLAELDAIAAAEVLQNCHRLVFPRSRSATTLYSRGWEENKDNSVRYHSSPCLLRSTCDGEDAKDVDVVNTAAAGPLSRSQSERTQRSLSQRRSKTSPTLCSASAA